MEETVNELGSPEGSPFPMATDAEVESVTRQAQVAKEEVGFVVNNEVSEVEHDFMIGVEVQGI